MSRRYRSSLLLAVAAISPCAVSAQAAQPAVGPAAPVAAADRWTQLLLPLLRNGQLSGDIVAEVTSDGRIRYARDSLIERLTPFLAPGAIGGLETAFPSAPFLTPEEVEAAGITLRYNPSLLEVVVERIDPTIAAVQTLGPVITESRVPITRQPQDFSAYLNVVGDFRIDDFDTFEEPGVLLFGAVRYRGFVVEFDGGYDRALTGGSGGFYRRSARLVYDQIDHLRRWSAGDLQLGGLPIISGAVIGGVAVEKGRRVFTGVGPVTQLGSQQILLDRDATVEVIVDGQQVQTLQLAAGPYDLSQLTAQYGGRNAQLFVTDVTGRRQVASFDPFFDPVDLGAGEEEYSAALGFVARQFGAQPVYGGLPVFSGYYRRGMTNRLLLGGALQLSEDIQVVGAEMTISPRSIPGRFEMSGAVSFGGGTGVALRGAYSIQFGSDSRGRQFSISADYRSGGFRTLSDRLSGGQFESLSVTANFSQSLSERTSLVAGLNWFDRAGFTNSRTAYVDIIHRTERFRLTAGIEYGSGSTFVNDFGVRVGITVPFGRRSRAEANYNSRRETFRAFASRSYEDRVGSFGYDVGVSTTPGNATVDAIANYVGNRFYARASVASSGPRIGDVDQRQQARMQVGTSFAFTGGAFAIGRPINDSFVIASPHESVEDGQVVLGRSVQDRRYDALSGTFGPALGSRLQSYSRQNIIYDLVNAPPGYDIGSGIETVEPPYRSGYRLVVGSDANVTAYGFLNVGENRATLLSGTITGIDDDEFSGQPFFTNSVGRFAITGLRPGKTYEVRLFDPAVTYRIVVPEDAQPLFQLGEISVADPRATPR